MTDPAQQHAPQAALALSDAHQHVIRAVAALRAAAALDPHIAREAGATHSALVDQGDALARLLDRIEVAGKAS